MTLVAFSIAFFLSLFVVTLLARHNRFLFILDKPNDRSLHQVDTPKTGGVAILLSVLLVVPFIFKTTQEEYLLLYFFILGGISLLNDKRELGIKVRLVAQALVVLLFLYQINVGEFFNPRTPDDEHALDFVEQVIVLAMSVIAVVWFINLYNFMDGMDGFAGGMTIFGFSGFTLATLLGGVFSVPTFYVVVIAATLGFLVFNFPKAKIFMGDSGSISLGFLAGATGILLITNKVISTAFFLVLFSPFIVDASYTLFKRVLRREKFWRAHRIHIYQRLALSPLGVKRTLLLQYLLMACCLFSALVEHHFKLPYTMLLIWSIIYSILILFAERYIARHEKVKTME